MVRTVRNVVPSNRCVHGITIGVRCVGCESGKCHHGFPLDHHCPTCATFRKPTAPPHDSWVERPTMPVRSGWFRVQIAGDEEPGVYSYTPYATWAFCTIDEEGEAHFKGTHDEETCMVTAWFGPVAIPAYKGG